MISDEKNRRNTAICRPDYDFRRKIARYAAVRKTKTWKQIFSAPTHSHEDPVDNQLRKAVEESDPKGELRDIAWSSCFVQRSEGRQAQRAATSKTSSTGSAMTYQ